MSEGRIDDVRRWVFDVALPFWSTTGVDGPHGFFEHADLTGRPGLTNYKRIRLQARQIYVFSHAALLGWRDGLGAASSGVEFLLAHGRAPEGGWVRRMGRTGGVVDGAADLYDHAFVLFALAWWGRAAGDPRAKTLADETLEAIDRRLGRADGRGWHAELPPPAEALQNPHMHLFEACLALYETYGDAVYAERARRIAELFLTTFCDPRTGVLTEYFDANWKPIPGSRGRVAEPGHQFEWAWLLRRAAAPLRLDERALAAADALSSFAERHGVDQETGLAWDEVLTDGTPFKRSSRCWPQTEMLKSRLSALELSRGGDHGPVLAAIDVLFRRYLAPARPGLWIEHLDETGRPFLDRAPASTLYHLFLAFSEVLRLEALLTRRAEAAA